MGIIKVILRIIIAGIFIVPSIPILWATFSLFGLAFIMVPVGFLGIIFNWLISDNESMRESIENFMMPFFILAVPFVFWYEFIIGNNPFKELDL